MARKSSKYRQWYKHARSLGYDPERARRIAKTYTSCYIATAVYGSYDCPQVWVLRRYRDDILANSFFGRAFIRIYYSVSPILVKWFGNMNWFKSLFKYPLDKLVNHLISTGVENTPYNDK